MLWQVHEKERCATASVLRAFQEKRVLEKNVKLAAIKHTGSGK
jgi:hypothetical protein